ncbi:MAG: DUF1801 domain-containing protein [Sphingopyxis solisilvae]|uniref:DUF1801 domain-containing protein n=1 Tax=Sphingopyxis solisilvae TaxID=1886788 RepID=UPI004036F2C0
MPTKHTSIDAFLATLTADQRPIVDKLRELAAHSADGVSEHIKWNAPSFCIDGDDRITLGLSPKGVVRVVLHRGATAPEDKHFSFDDPAGLIRWQAADRGVLHFDSFDDLIDKESAVGDIFARWMETTR